MLSVHSGSGKRKKIRLSIDIMSGSKERKTRPIIGISASKISSAGENYVKAVRRAGGIPVIITITDDEDELNRVLGMIDGLLMSGGVDVHPQRYGESPIPEIGNINPERDEFDIRLVRLASDKGLPILAICRGIQVMNVAFGGTLYQDIPAQHPTADIVHRVKAENVVHHHILINEGTLLYELLGRRAGVNTSHHQAVKDLAPGFIISAMSEDGVVEGIEKPGHPCVIGVQFHPESFVAEGDDSLLPLFTHLIETAGKNCP